jgi:hypothetical protein
MVEARTVEEKAKEDISRKRKYEAADRPAPAGIDLTQVQAPNATDTTNTRAIWQRSNYPPLFSQNSSHYMSPAWLVLEWKEVEWSDVNRLSNSFACIPDHVITCRVCPKEVIDALLVLKDRHKSQMQSIPRGSQKHCLRKIWKKLHADDNINTGSAAT